MENKSDKIFDYLQGNLDGSEEAELFSALSYNEELRNEFRTFTLIEKSLKSTSKTFIPPVSVSNNIFSQLGVQQNSTFRKSSIAGKTLHKLVRKKVFPIILTGFVSSAITFLLMYNLFNPEIISKEIPLTEKNNTILKSEGIIIPTDKVNISDIKSRKNSHVNSYFAVNHLDNEKAIDKNIISNVSENVNNDEIQISQISTDKINDNIENFPFNLRLNSQKFINKQIQNTSENSQFTSKNNDFNISNFGIEVKNSMYWNMPKETVSPSELSKFHNMSIALLYDISDDFSLGVELRQETFFVKYFSKNEFNEKYIFEQQPNLTSYGGLLRYKFINNEQLKIFVQNNFSLNNYGIIFRGSIGFEYYLVPELSVMGIVDFAGLYYQHQNNSNTAEKVGFSYGINYKF